MKDLLLATLLRVYVIVLKIQNAVARHQFRLRQARRIRSLKAAGLDPARVFGDLYCRKDPEGVHLYKNFLTPDNMQAYSVCTRCGRTLIGYKVNGQWEIEG